MITIKLKSSYVPMTYLFKIHFYLKGKEKRSRDRERERDQSFTCWFTAGLGLIQSQEPEAFSSSPCGCKGLGYLLLFSEAH